MKIRKGDRVIWKPKPGSVWDYPSKRWRNVPPVGTVGIVTRDQEKCGMIEMIEVLWEDKGCASDRFPFEYVEPYTKPQAGINWLYPGSGEWKEGDAIIAEYVLAATGVRSIGFMQCRKIYACGYSYYAWEFKNGDTVKVNDIDIKAYIPYAEPNPPEKPQYCPFCGSEMCINKLGHYATERFQIACPGECILLIRNKRLEVIKAFNSVKVVSDEKNKKDI